MRCQEVNVAIKCMHLKGHARSSLFSLLTKRYTCRNSQLDGCMKHGHLTCRWARRCPWCTAPARPSCLWAAGRPTWTSPSSTSSPSCAACCDEGCEGFLQALHPVQRSWLLVISRRCKAVVRLALQGNCLLRCWPAEERTRDVSIIHSISLACLCCRSSAIDCCSTLAITTLHCRFKSGTYLAISNAGIRVHGGD